MTFMPFSLHQLLMLAGFPPPDRPAVVAKARLKRIIAQDRERVPACRWVKLQRPRGWTRVVASLAVGPIYFGGKPVYRWERRR